MSRDIFIKWIELGKNEYEQFLSMGREVDRHYTTVRYPDALPFLSPKEAYDLEIAERVQKQVSIFLNFIESNVINKEDKNNE